MININNVVKTYYDGMNKTEVLKGVNLMVSEGETVALMGRSGSGKSTLLNIIGGLISPTKGCVTIDGEETDYTNTNSLYKLRREKIGYVLQDFALISRKNVLNNVTFAVRSKEYREKSYAKVKGMLADVGLIDKLESYPFQLSNGEKQRVAIVRALVDNKRILLADEPTGALDAENAERIMSIIKEKVKENNMAALIVTHDKDVAAKCDRVVNIEYGMIRSGM